MKQEKKNSLNQLESCKNREIDELKEKLQMLSVNNNTREKLSTENQTNKMMKYKRVIFMLRVIN